MFGTDASSGVPADRAMKAANRGNSAVGDQSIADESGAGAQSRATDARVDERRDAAFPGSAPANVEAAK